MDIFLLKYRADGELAWARRAGGTVADQAFAVAAGPDGSAYLTGYFTGSANFGALAIKATTAHSAVQFLAKYDADGSVAWVQTVAGECGSRGYSVATLPDGSAYVTGTFSGRCTLRDVSFTALGGSDIFVAKYRADGALLWATSAGGAAGATSRSVAVHADGSFYITGQFSGTFQFGDKQLIAAGTNDLFLTKYNADRSVAWVRRAGDFGRAVAAYSVAALKDGAVYITGDFTGSIDFGGKSLEGGKPMFLAKYAPDGGLVWVHSINPEMGVGYAVAALADGTAFVTGELDHRGYRSLFLAKVRADGVLQRLLLSISEPVSITDRAASSSGAAVSVRQDCSVHVAGRFASTWTLDPTTFTTPGDDDVLAFRLTPAL